MSVDELLQRGDTIAAVFRSALAGVRLPFSPEPLAHELNLISDLLERSLPATQPVFPGATGGGDRGPVWTREVVRSPVHAGANFP